MGKLKDHFHEEISALYDGPDAIPSVSDAYAAYHEILAAKPASHRNARDWLAIADAELLCERAKTWAYLMERRKHG